MPKWAVVYEKSTRFRGIIRSSSPCKTILLRVQLSMTSTQYENFNLSVSGHILNLVTHLQNENHSNRCQQNENPILRLIFYPFQNIWHQIPFEFWKKGCAPPEMLMWSEAGAWNVCCNFFILTYPRKMQPRKIIYYVLRVSKIKLNNEINRKLQFIWTL